MEIVIGTIRTKRIEGKIHRSFDVVGDGFVLGTGYRGPGMPYWEVDRDALKLLCDAKAVSLLGHEHGGEFKWALRKLYELLGHTVIWG